jgi:hypothetical protein
LYSSCPASYTSDSDKVHHFTFHSIVTDGWRQK